MSKKCITETMHFNYPFVRKDLVETTSYNLILLTLYTHKINTMNNHRTFSMLQLEVINFPH